MTNFDLRFPAPLGDPANHVYSARESSGNIAGLWKTWAPETHLERLYERCDAMLALILEQQKEIAELKAKAHHGNFR